MDQRQVSLLSGVSGRIDCFTTLKPQAKASRRSRRGVLNGNSQVTEAQADRGFGEAVKNVARQVQGALPIVGLISRLASTSGGIGRDEIAYPEFARQLLDKADSDFNQAVADWEARYDRVGQRRYILLFLWMARTGLGLVPSKQIANAALRLRVTHDLGMEMERFEGVREQSLQVYSYSDRPKGKTREQIGIAVDALCRLSIGIKDGEPIPEVDKPLLTTIVAQAFNDIEGVDKLTEEAVSDDARQARKSENL